MGQLKRFDPDEVDESLTRVIGHNGYTYLLFPYIDGLGSAPKFSSIGCLINGPSASAKDLAALALLLRQASTGAAWFLSFNTPWLLRPSEADVSGQRPRRG